MRLSKTQTKIQSLTCVHQMRKLSGICLLTVLLVASATGATASSLPAFPSLGPTGTPQSASDSSLAAVRQSDRAIRTANGKLSRLSASEHLRRASIYATNRAFAEAREHWEALLNYYPEDPNVPEALFGIGRTYFQSRRYEQAFSFYDRVARNYPATKEGREGLNFSASAALRMGRPSDAADRYRQYTEKYPTGERAESAHLNLIDALRETGKSKEAIEWITRTREKFPNTPTDTNALFARLRLDVAEANWKHAITSAEELASKRFQKGTLTTAAEVAYLKAYSLEQAGRREEALNTYLGIPDGIDSYYGWLASERAPSLADARTRSIVNSRSERVGAQISAAATLYPAPYREAILSTSRARKLDPRFVLAIIRQESVFKPQAKSPSGARGLLQLTIDAAQKYAPGAGLSNVRESELYRPETSIQVGGEYLADLTRMFPNLLEAVAASYNGGEDNVARWVKRAKQKDPGVFTSEVGFDETKAYVQKVMANYRAYRQLYTMELVRR
jgi:soluble lytic murein transglycosylase